jgi:hypothetical protein
MTIIRTRPQWPVLEADRAPTDTQLLAHNMAVLIDCLERLEDTLGVLRGQLDELLDRP